MDMNALMTMLVNNGIGVACAAAVLVFAWYRETKTLPQMMETFSKAHAENVQAFTSGMESLQRSFTERNTQTLKTFAELAREERSNYQRWHEENRNRLDQILSENKEQRHYVRDLANQVGLRRAVEDERRRLGEDPCPPPP